MRLQCTLVVPVPKTGFHATMSILKQLKFDLLAILQVRARFKRRQMLGEACNLQG